MSNKPPPPNFDIEDPPTDEGIMRDRRGTMPFMRASTPNPLPVTPFAQPPPQPSVPNVSRGQTMDPRIHATYGQSAAVPFAARSPMPATPLPPVRHDPRAAFSGLGSASNAAVDAAPVEARRAEPDRASAPRSTPAEYIDLVWFDASAPSRVREQAAWTELLRDAPKSNDWVVGDEAERPNERGRDERQVRRALARVPAIGADALPALLAGAIDEDGVLERPLCVVGGDLVMAFDPSEVLRTTIAASAHFAAVDKKLKDTLDAASEVLGESKRVAASFLEGVASRIRAAFGSAPRGVAADYLETTVERMLLEERKYLRRNVLGGAQLCGELLADGAAAMPAYLDAQLTYQLPLFRRFRVRLLAEPHPPQDPSDAGQIALKVLALARVVSRRR